MPLRRFPPRPDRPSPNGSRRDALYDQLLSSLGVSDKLATSEEHWQWVHEQRRAGQNFSLLDQRAPWPMQRYEALNMIRVFPFETYRLARETMQEVEYLDEPSETPPPLDEAQLQSEWIQWRNGLIQLYQLQAFVQEDPPSPSDQPT